MILSQLKPDQCFISWDGTEKRLKSKSVGRAMIEDSKGKSEEVSLGMEIEKVIANLSAEQPPKAAGKGMKDEDTTMGPKEQALRALREKASKTKATRPAAPKAAPVKAAKAETKKAVKKSDGKRGSIFLFEHPVTSVVRWMGKDEFSFVEAYGALRKHKVSPMPTEGCVRTFLYAGKKGERGEPAKLTADQQKSLRVAAKKVVAENK